MATNIKRVVNLPKVPADSGLPKKEEDWARYIRRLHDEGLARRRRYEFQWVINLSYYLGYQELLLNTGTGIIEIPKEYRNPIHVNRVGSFIESRHAKITKNRPQSRVFPNSTEPADKHAAKASDDLLRHLWRAIDMDQQYDRLTMLELLCGTSFMKTVWDPLAGDIIKQPVKHATDTEDEFEVELTDDGSVAEEEVFLGEISCRARSTFNLVVPDENTPDIRDQEWVIERSHMTSAEITRIWPHLEGKIAKKFFDDELTEYEKTIDRMASPLFKSSMKAGADTPDKFNSRALGIEIWFKPNFYFPDGLMAVVIGNEIAVMDKFPHDYGKNKYPYVKFSEKEDGYHFYPQATIERLIPVQRAINRLKQHKLRSTFLMANPKWLLAKGSQVSEDSLTDEVGEVVEYNPSVPAPKPAEIAPLPAYVSNFGEELIRDFRDVGGQRESTVTPPPNLTAAVALQVAAEQADEVVGPIVRRQTRGMELVAEQQLRIANAEYSEPRKIKILGEHNRVMISYLSGMDLKHHFDVHIEIESMIPDFRGSKRQTLLELWDRRIIQDPQKILNAFRYGMFEEVLEEEEKNLETVEMDIAVMKKGKAPAIFPAQNHLLYVRELTKFIQTPEFLALIPERRELFLQVLQAHLGFVQQQMPQGPMPQTNQAAVGTPFGPQKPAGIA